MRPKRRGARRARPLLEGVALCIALAPDVVHGAPVHDENVLREVLEDSGEDEAEEDEEDGGCGWER